MPFYEFEAKKPVVDSEAFVHPDAVVIGSVIIEALCYIGAGAVLRGDIGDIWIGKGSNVQENCVFHTFPERSTIVHPNAHIGHSSILHSCEICSHVLVGMGSVIGDGVKINPFCIVGAGSFVPLHMQIPEHTLVAGSPARVIKKIGPEHLAQIKGGLATYQGLTIRYLKAFRKISPEDVTIGLGGRGS